MRVTILGLEELRRELDKMEPKAMNRLLQKGLAEGGKFLKPKVQAEAPRRTGKLRKSISRRTARRDKPAIIISARPKIAFYRHMVIRGTKPHRIRFPDQKAAGVPKAQGNIQHPGAKADPFIKRAGDKYGDQAMQIAIAYISKELP